MLAVEQRLPVDKKGSSTLRPGDPVLEPGVEHLEPLALEAERGISCDSIRELLAERTGPSSTISFDASRELLEERTDLFDGGDPVAPLDEGRRMPLRERLSRGNSKPGRAGTVAREARAELEALLKEKDGRVR